jgi:hypothetical protein
MTIDISLFTKDGDDPGLEFEHFLKCTSYKVGGKRNVLRFPIKLLKVMNDIYKIVSGDYDIPPVIAIDTGSTVRTYTVEFYLAGVGDDPVDDVEEKADVLMEFIERDSWMADQLFLQIGDHVTKDHSSFALMPNAMEGKIVDYEFEWEEKASKMLKCKIEFLACHEIDWF